MKLAALLVFLFAAAGAAAQPIALPAPPRAAIVQRLGAELPLSLPLLDANGHATTLGAELSPTTPVLLVPGYYGCPELCGLVMHGLLEAVHASGLGPGAARIVRVSIDPQDTPATAAAAKSRDLSYAKFLGGPGPDLRLLVGSAANTAAIARAVGYRYETVAADRREDEPAARFAHPAAVIVVTPQGRVSRYFMGVHFDPAELRAAVDEAGRGSVGSLTDQLALLCAHFDPRVGRHSEAVMNGLRALGLLIVAGLGAWTWRRRDASGGAP